MKKQARRELLQLAHTFDPSKPKIKIAGWYLSEKLDGTRCLWDGGISRGEATREVPYASILNPKTGKPKDKVKPVATGLWSRYGNPIMAPDWFLDSLPKTPLDGELWAGRGKFQLCRSICGGDTPDPRFDQIRYAVYSSPSWDRLFGSGLVKNSNMLCELTDAMSWVNKRISYLENRECTPGGPADTCQLFTSCFYGDDFQAELEHLMHTIGARVKGSMCYVHHQTKLHENEATARLQVEGMLEDVLNAGGEGVIIRNPEAHWTPKRIRDVLKYKPFDDAEGIVTGFTSGRETDRGSKFQGKIGALILNFKGKRLELSGLTDEEREFADPAMVTYAESAPGQDMPPNFQGKHFKVGQKVTFKYRELSDDGIPKEARYWRRRDEE